MKAGRRDWPQAERAVGSFSDLQRRIVLGENVRSP